MARSDKVKFSVEADTKQAEGALDRVGKKVGMSGALKGALDGFADLKGVADLAFGAVSGVADGLGEVWKAAKEGAQLEFTIKKFDRLSTSIGTTSELLLKDLKTATRGTFSDMELAGSATDFLTLGLAKSHDEVIRLSRVSSALGMDMNQLVLTLTNQTTMRFDALGLSVDGFDAKVAALKKTGLSTDAAFKEAFLQTAEAQINRVGDVADTNAGKIMQMEAAGKNLSDALKMALAPAAAEAASSLTDLITYFDRMEERFATGNKEAVIGAKNYKDYALELARLAQETDPVNKNLANTIYYLRKTNGAYQENKISLRELRDMTDEELIALMQQEGSLNSLITTLGGYSEGTYAAAGSMDYADRMAQNLAQSTDELGKKIDEAAAKTWSVADAMSEYSTRLLFNKAAANLDDEAALLLAQSMGLVDQATITAMKVMDDLTQKRKDGTITTGGYKKAITDLDLAIRSLTDRHITITTTHIDEYISTGSSYGGGNRGDERFGGSQEEAPTPPAANPVVVVPAVPYHNRAEDEYAAGGSFQVPPGYLNDSYPLGPGKWASSGETVTISPTFQITQQPGQDGATLADMVMQRLSELTRQKRLSGARYMGG